MAEKQQRRIVYFLGAGASLGAGANAPIQAGGRLPIPTQDVFWETFLRFCQSERNRKTIEQFLFRYFLGYRKVPSRTKANIRRKLLQPIDVEEVFTFLSERNNAPNVSPSLRLYTKRIWETLVGEIGEVFFRYRPNKQTRSTYKKFRQKHLRSRDTVVSFNYDTIFEGSLPADVEWHYGGINIARRVSLRVLKPHGSINWRLRDDRSIRTMSTATQVDDPVVVAPTHLKFVVSLENSYDEDLDELIAFEDETSLKNSGYLNRAPQIENVWTSMEKEMREAKGWVFVGYSFPSSDLYFSSILRSALAVRKSDPFVVIVNPDSMAISKRLQSRFAIPREKMKLFSDLQTFNEVSREQVIQMLS